MRQRRHSVCWRYFRVAKTNGALDGPARRFFIEYRPVRRSVGLGSGLLGLGDFSLQLDALGRQLFVFGFGQESVKSAAVLDRLQGVSADTEADPPVQRVACQRDVAEIGAECPL